MHSFNPHVQPESAWNILEEIKVASFFLFHITGTGFGNL